MIQRRNNSIHDHYITISSPSLITDPYEPSQAQRRFEHDIVMFSLWSSPVAYILMIILNGLLGHIWSNYVLGLSIGMLILGIINEAILTVSCQHHDGYIREQAFLTIVILIYNLYRELQSPYGHLLIMALNLVFLMLPSYRLYYHKKNTISRF